MTLLINWRIGIQHPSETWMRPMSITSFEVILPCPPTLQFRFDPWNGARSQFYKPFSFQVYRHFGTNVRPKTVVHEFLLASRTSRGQWDSSRESAPSVGPGIHRAHSPATTIHTVNDGEHARKERVQTPIRILIVVLSAS